jgi:antirestriction protein ArdC
MAESKKLNVYEAVTDRLIAQLDQGIIPWSKPWTGRADGAISGTTGKAYSLLNQFLLSKPGKYYTFRQASELGGHVRKGEKAQFVTFWKTYPVTRKNDEGEEVTESFPVLRYYNVFHESQIDGLPVSDPQPVQVPTASESAAEAERLIRNYLAFSGIKLSHVDGGDKACYSPTFDAITLPAKTQFPREDEYYSTAFHEMTHSTGAKSRLDRQIRNQFGSSLYGKEELVAEMGAAILVNHCGMESKQSFSSSTAYLQSWIKALKNDVRLAVSAASKAAKAADYILSAPDVDPVPAADPVPDPVPAAVPSVDLPQAIADREIYISAAHRLVDSQDHANIRISYGSGWMEIDCEAWCNTATISKTRQLVQLIRSDPDDTRSSSNLDTFRDCIRGKIGCNLLILDGYTKYAKRLTAEVKRWKKFETLCA